MMSTDHAVANEVSLNGHFWGTEDSLELERSLAKNVCAATNDAHDDATDDDVMPRCATPINWTPGDSRLYSYCDMVDFVLAQNSDTSIEWDSIASTDEKQRSDGEDL